MGSSPSSRGALDLEACQYMFENKAGVWYKGTITEMNNDGATAKAKFDDGDDFQDLLVWGDLKGVVGSRSSEAASTLSCHRQRHRSADCHRLPGRPSSRRSADCVCVCVCVVASRPVPHG